MAKQRAGGYPTLARMVGAELERARGDRSHKEIADALGWSKASVVGLEQGRANPTLARLEAVADVYGIEFVVRVRRRKGNAA